MKNHSLFAFLSLASLLALTGCGDNPASSSSASSVSPSSSSATSSSTALIETGEQQVIHETKFNSSYIALQNEDFTKFGFAWGDSCDVYFSNGQKIEDVPYYDGYYTRSDFPLICGYQGYPYVQITVNNSSDFWEQYELTDETKVNVVLREKAKYIDAQEAFSMHYLNDRDQFPSDEVFANFREVGTSNIASGKLYRGASPFNDTYNRAPYVDALLKEKEAKFILDLSDTEADMEAYEKTYDLSNSYAMKQEKVLLGLGSNFRLCSTPEEEDALEPDFLGVFGASTYKVNLANGLKKMAESDGPYYVHCVEGKDRTGFVCMLLEALCGGNYAEMKQDYMQTYTNYFQLQPGEAKYEAVCHLRFDEFLEYLSGSTDIENLSYVEFAKAYLRDGGMTDTEIDGLIAKLEGK